MFFWGIMMASPKITLLFDITHVIGRLFKASLKTFLNSWVRLFFFTEPRLELGLGMRWLLGMFEAGLFPGVNYYLSWYDLSLVPNP